MESEQRGMTEPHMATPAQPPLADSRLDGGAQNKGAQGNGAGGNSPALHPNGLHPNGSRRWLFVLTILTGSFLLFLVQPMVARMAMPRLGGAPAVWISAQLVYQALLLGGYAYAHYLTRFTPRTQSMVHIGLFAFALLWLPVGLVAAYPPANASVILFVPWLLAASIGPLFLAVAAQAPLMQRWFHFHAPAADPYPLYAASNIGSFAGLIAYPLVVEPALGNSGQSWLWSGIYLALLLLVGACAFTIYRDRGDAGDKADIAQSSVDEAPPTLKRKLHWIVLAAVPSGLMLATTTHITTDMMSIPLLWALPLGLYLLSFSIAFAEKRGLADLILFLSPFLILCLGGTALFSVTTSPILMLSASLTLLFVVAVAMHSLMYRDRPSPRYLTQFYLLMSVGGVIGGIFCALLAPVIFNWVYEYPILILAAAALIPQNSLLPSMGSQSTQKMMRYVQIALAAIILAAAIYYLYNYGTPSSENIAYVVIPLLLFGVWTVGNRPAMMIILLSTMLLGDGWDKLQLRTEAYRTRSYFGIYNVYADHSDNMMKLVNGTTLHGTQNLEPAESTEPTSYYGSSSGVGIVLNRAQQLAPKGARVGIVGLGAGTLACYKQLGQEWHFYEIDPVMADIAKNPKHFSFLSQCTPDAPVHIGDARLTLDKQADSSLDILVIDAFSSDAIPMHLLTREAFAVYRRVLGEDGILVVHISNRYFDLEPVIDAESRKGGWVTSARWDYPDEALTSVTASTWVAMAATQERLNIATAHDVEYAPEWNDVHKDPTFPGWTDDYGSVLPLVKFWKKEEE